MNKFPLYQTVFYISLAAAAASTLYVMAIMPLTGASHGQIHTAPSQTTVKEHDATNSDGHHSVEAASTSDQIDLTNQATVNIDIKDFKYAKSNIKIKKGTTVVWTYRDTMEHNVMAEHSNSEEAHDAPTEETIQEDVLSGPMLAKGESYSFTFNEAGTDPYHCSPHPYMKGSVTVVN